MFRKRYSREFKLEAVARVAERDRPVAEVADELGIDRCMLYRWQRELTASPEDSFPGNGVRSPEAAELAKLKRELAQTKLERDILKKVLRVFGGQKP